MGFKNSRQPTWLLRFAIVVAITSLMVTFICLGIFLKDPAPLFSPNRIVTLGCAVIAFAIGIYGANIWRQS